MLKLKINEHAFYAIKNKTKKDIYNIEVSNENN